MAVLAQKTLVGNVGTVYELRTVGKDNKSVVDFTVAVTPRKRTPEGEWVDGDTLWHTVTAWGKLADNVVESLNKGDQVIVHGREEMKPGYTNKAGEEVPGRPIVVADFVGLELGRHAAKSARVPGAGGGNSRPASSAPAQSKPQAAAPAETDIFANDDFSVDFDADEPPF